MLSFTKNNFLKSGLVFILPVFSLTPSVIFADDIVESLKAGTFGGSVRIRYEDVEDDSKATGFTDAEALTTRFTLKYTSGDFYKTFFHVEFEHVLAVTDDDEYNDGTNGLGAFPAIVDPEGTEVNEGYLGLKPFENTVVKVGRQILTPRKAPFHRFLGTVLWRQNWSTQDAVTITNSSLPNTKIMAGYIWNNNFINQADRDLEAPIFNIQYSGFKYANLEAYYYDLNFTNPGQTGLGSETLGVRVNGTIPLNETISAIYAGEYATQSESDDNTTSYDADYYLAEGGFKFNFKDSFIKSVMAKLSYEVMEADTSAGTAFKTPLATGHAYFGWADNFLATPAQGIEDTYITMVATGAYDTKLIVAYHMLDPETDTTFDEYGSEFDIWFTKTFEKKYTVGLKYADYSGDGGVGNPKSTDLSKFWAYFVLKF